MGFAGNNEESSAFKGRMAKMHQEYAREGWTLQDVSVYTENGDLEGFFITYLKEK